MSKNILYFMDYGQTFGGATETLLLQAILMRKNGNKVVVCFSSRCGDGLIPAYCRMCAENGILLLQLPYTISSCTEGINVVSVLEDYEVIKNLIVYFKPDILHSVQINVTVELISRELCIPHIMNIYSALPSFFSLPYMDVWPKYIICDSLFWANVWKKGLGVDATCIRTVAQHPALKSCIEDCPTRYICVGAIYSGKNQLEVIKGFHRLILSGIRAQLDLYGYDSDFYAEKCRKYVSENSLNTLISFHGYCNDMQNVYENSDAIIVGSTRESYPNVVSESLAHSVVVISTPVGGVPEVIKDSFNGYIAEGYTGEDIYKKLIQFEQDKISRACDALLKNANETYIAEHSESAVYEKLLARYDYVQNTFSRNGSPAVRISDVQKEFNGILTLYKQSQLQLMNPDPEANMLWYFFHAMQKLKFLPSDSRFYIWGAGKRGLYAKENLEVFFPFIHLTGFVDSKKEGTVGEYAIYKPENVLSDEKSVIGIAVINGQWDIIDVLEKCGKICNKTYFFLVPRLW